MKLTIEPMRGVWRAQNDSRTFFDDTLEGLLVQLAPDAPEEYLWHAAEVLGTILGAEVVEVQPSFAESDPEGWAEMRDLLLERWAPTDDQNAYFQPQRTEEVEHFSMDDDDIPPEDT